MSCPATHITGSRRWCGAPVFRCGLCFVHDAVVRLGLATRAQVLAGYRRNTR